MNADHFDFDVIVVGGGPAGAITAYTVAKSGYKVAILDKKKRNQIGDKTCGDALDKASVLEIKRELGINEPEGDEVSDIIKKMSIASQGLETKATLTAPGYVVDRLIYGQRLLDECEELGVQIFPQHPVRKLIIEESTVSGVTAFVKGQEVMFRAKFVVDASGAYATIKKLLPTDFLFGQKEWYKLENDMIWPTYREIIKLNDGEDHDFHNEIVLIYDDEIPIPGYFWIFSKGQGELNVGIGWLKSEQNMPSLKEAYKETLSKYVSPGSYEVLKSGGGQIPIRLPFNNLVFNGGLLVGDAACLVHPSSAEGHGPALYGGLYAGRTLSNALKEGGRTSDKLWRYNELIHKGIGEKHATAYILRKFLEDVHASGVEFLFKREVLTNEDLDTLIRGDPLNFGLLDLLSKGIKLFPRYDLILPIRSAIQTANKLRTQYSSYPGSTTDLMDWVKERNKIIGYDF